MSSMANYFIHGPNGIALGFNAIGANDIQLDGVEVTTGGGGGGGGNANVTLAQVLQNGDDAGGSDIVNVGNLACNQTLNVGSISGNQSLIGMCYGDGTTNSDYIRLYADAVGYIVQYLPSGINPKNILKITPAGALTVSNGTQTGRVYDDTIYVPPSSGTTFAALLAQNSSAGNNSISAVDNLEVANINGCTTINVDNANIVSQLSVNSIPVLGVGSITYFSNANQTLIAPSVATVVTFSTEATNSNVNTTLNSVYSYDPVTGQYNFTSDALILVTGYLNWQGPVAPTSSRNVYIQRIVNSTPVLEWSDTKFVVANGGDFAHSFSAALLIQAGQGFCVQVLHTDSGSMTIYANSRLTITRLA